MLIFGIWGRLEVDSAMPLPTADFSYTPKVDNPLQINFTDTSTGDIQKWKWDFGDGSLPLIFSPEQKTDGTLINTFIELSTIVSNVSGNTIVCRTNESLLGQDLNNNSMFDPILQYYDISSKTLVNTMAIASNVGPVISGDIIAFVTKERDAQMDLNGDGKLSNDIAMYYDIGRNEIVSTGAETLYNRYLSISGNIIAFVTFDGLTFKLFVRYFDRTVGKVFNTGGMIYTSSSPLVSGNIIAFPTNEREYLGDLNGDGDFNDLVLRYFDITNSKLINTTAEMFGIEFSIFGNKIAFISYEGFVNTTGTDLNGDGDKTDFIVRYFDVSSGRIINIGDEVKRDTRLSMSKDIIAFITPEASTGKDLNGDGDTNDDVLRYYDLSTRTIVNTTAEIFSNPSVDGKIIAFLTNESSVGRNGTDLNSDGDTSDIVVRYFDASTGILHNTGAEGAGKDLSMSGNVIAFQTIERTIGANGLDLNGNGNLEEIMLRYFILGGQTFNGSTSHFYEKPGTYPVTLTITDKTGQTSSVKKDITVGQVVSPPTANFTASSTSGDVPLTVNFIDTSTNDPTSRQWDFGNRQTSIQQSPIHTYNTAGDYTVSLTASNQSGPHTKTIPNYITVTASDTTNPTVSITQPIDNATVQGAIIIKAIASDDLGVNRVEFYLDNTLRSADNTPAYEYSWDTNTVIDGQHALKAKAYDDAGNSREDVIKVTVSNVIPNRPPILNPIDNQGIDEGKELRFIVSAFDPDNDPLTYSTSPLPSGSSYNPSTQTFSWTPNNNQSGDYSLTFNVTDNKSPLVSETITIIVKDVVIPQCSDGIDNDGDGRIDLNDPGCSSPADGDETDTPPVDNPLFACINNSNQTVGSGELVRLDGSCSFDLDTDPLTYQWTQTSGRSVVLRDPMQAITDFIAPDVAQEEAAELKFQLTVSAKNESDRRDSTNIEAQSQDQQGKIIDADQITIFTDFAPLISLTNPQDHQTIRVKEKITVQAQYSPHNNGITKTEFIIINQTTNKQIRKQTDRSSPYQLNWTVPGNALPNTTYFIQAKGYSKDITNREVLIGPEEIRVEVE